MKLGTAEKAACALALALALTFAAEPTRAAAQEAADTVDVERRARLQRQGGGFRIGLWHVTTLTERAGQSDAAWPMVEGYWQRGLDLHLAVESSVGVWRREVTLRSSGALGGETTESATVYVVPLLTSLKVFPFTTPDAGFEPFALAGLGFAVGVEDHQGQGTLLGGGSGTNVLTGFGLKGGVGAQWRFDRAFGGAAAVRYQWIRFGNPVAGDRTYAGPGFDVGLTYRFQY